MANNTLIVIRREFLERVKKKSFIITTLIMPLVMLALMVTPVLISMYATGDAKKVMVIDRSQVLAPGLTDSETITFTDMPASEGDDYWKHALDNEDVDAVLIIPADIVDGAAGVKLYTAGASSMNLEMEITSRLNSLIENQRIQNYGYKDLRQIIDAVHSDVSLQSITYDGDDEKASSTTLSYILGIALTMMLYMCLLIYGQMVMTSIIEEKGNRVLELVVSSVKPTQLMLGKICGIGLVAVTQIIIWGVLIAAMSAFLLPALLPADVAAQVTAINAGGAAGAVGVGIIVAAASAAVVVAGVVVCVVAIVISAVSAVFRAAVPYLEARNGESDQVLHVEFVVILLVEPDAEFEAEQLLRPAFGVEVGECGDGA